MSGTVIQVTPSNISIAQVVIQSVQVILFNTATIYCTLYDGNSNVVRNQSIFMNSAEYANWSTDDSYIINFVLSQLGLVKAI